MHVINAVGSLLLIRINSCAMASVLIELVQPLDQGSSPSFASLSQKLFNEELFNEQPDTQTLLMHGSPVSWLDLVQALCSWKVRVPALSATRKVQPKPYLYDNYPRMLEANYASHGTGFSSHFT